MANTPKKLQDPAEAALSAIQTAINLRDGEQTPDGRGARSPDMTEASHDGLRRREPGSLDSDIFADESLRANEPDEDTPAQRRAANDDRRSVGQVLQALQRRPSRAPYVIAMVLSLAWIAAGLAVAFSYFDVKQILSRGALPELLLLVGAIGGPVIFFFALAHVIRQAHELRNVASSMTDVVIRLAEPETIARDSIVSVGQAIRREVAAMGDGVERALARAAELETLVHNEVAALERSYNDNELRIRGLIEDLANQRDTLVDQSEQVRSAITGVHMGLAQDISSISEMVASSVSDAAQRITRTLAEKGEHITLALGRAGDSMVDAIGVRGGDLLDDLNRTGESVSRTLEAASERMTSNLNVKTDHVNEQVETLTLKLSAMLTSRLDEVTQQASEKTVALAEDLARRTEELSANLFRTTETLTESIVTRSKNVTEALIDSGDRLADAITARTDEVNNTLKSTGESLVIDLTLRGTDVVSKLEETGSRIIDTIVTRTDEATQTLSDTAGQVTEKISQDSQELGNLITQNLAEFDRTVKVYGSELVDRLAQRSGEINETMRAHISDFDQRIGTRTGEVAGALDERFTRIEDIMSSRTQAFNEGLGIRVMEISRALDAVNARTDETQRSLAQFASTTAETIQSTAQNAERALDGMSSNVQRASSEISSNVERAGAELTQLIDDKAGKFLIAFDDKRQQLATNLDEITNQAILAIESKGILLSQSLRDNSQDIAQLVNDASLSASASISRSLHELHESAKSAIEQSQQTSAAAISEVMETQGMLRNDTTELLQRLREANLLLQDVLGGATENLGAIENALSARTSEFVNTLHELANRTGSANQKVEDNVKAFHHVTSNVLRDITMLTQQLDEQGRMLESVVTSIDGSNRRTETVLADRRQALDALIAHLDGKTEDVDRRLMNFAELLKASFNEAETQARQATRETDALFQQASERFAEVVQDVKEMSAEMRRELDVTRDEMRRGILELPQETAENAAQMRRVIVEQIDALSELNRIVARHGRGVDAVEPVRRTVRDEPLIANAGARSEPARTGNRSEIGNVERSTPVTSRRVDPAPSNPPAQNERGPGWLTDLLARASREETPAPRSEERSTRHTIESLDSLSVDIARMIDHDAAAELWDRYKRGERNIFTKRLYTLQGQKTFDEIRKRYRSDREFKQTVDRYIAEFERLLDEASQDDRGLMVTRTYLTSETGKVYTMLAHAAGRFDQ